MTGSVIIFIVLIISVFSSIAYVLHLEYKESMAKIKYKNKISDNSSDEVIKH